MLAFLLVFDVEKFSSQCLVAFASIISFYIFMIIKKWIFLYPSMNIHYIIYIPCATVLLMFWYFIIFPFLQCIR